jgi:hypothetical protein
MYRISYNFSAHEHIKIDHVQDSKEIALIEIPKQAEGKK